MRVILLGGLALLLLGGGVLTPAAGKARKETKSAAPARDSVLKIPRVSRAPSLDRLVEERPATGTAPAARSSKKKSEAGVAVAKENDGGKSRSDSVSTTPFEEQVRVLERLLQSIERAIVPAGATSTTPADTVALRPRADSARIWPVPAATETLVLETVPPIPAPVPTPVPTIDTAPHRTRPSSHRSSPTVRDHVSDLRTDPQSQRQARPAPSTTTPTDAPATQGSAPEREADSVAAGLVMPPHPTAGPGTFAPPARPRSGPPRAGPPREEMTVWLSIACAAIPTLWMTIAWAAGRKQRATEGVADATSDIRVARAARNGKRRIDSDREENGVANTSKNGRSHRDDGQPIQAPAVAAATAAVAAQKKRRSRLREMFMANLWRVKGSLALAAIFMALGAAVELLKPWPLKVILDHVIYPHPLPAHLTFLERLQLAGPDLMILSAAAIVVIALVGGAFSYAEVFITKAIGYRMVYALRREVFSHLQRLSLSFHNRARSGDLLTTFGKDTSTLKDVFAEALLKFADHFLSVAGMLVILWMINWRVALVALASLPFLCFTLMRLYRNTKLSLKKQRKQEGKVTSRMTEVLAAVPLVQAFGRERHEEERYEAVSNETLRESIRMTRMEAAASRSTHVMTALGTSATVLFGGLEVLNGRMLPGDLVLVMSYLSHMYKPLRSLAKLSIEVSKASASAERIGEVLEVEPEIQDRPDAIEAKNIRGEVVFASVSFDYGDGKEVLRHISFEIKPGQRLALVGASGAGKSTIASLILRLYEAQQGAILIDGIAIERLRRDSLRSQIGIVLQNSVLFGATIRENIAYGKPDATIEEIVAAAKAANADEFIRELEDGYDSIIGERGATLSAGQRQRIAIARTIIRNPRILILDEPMTGLDAENEGKVQQALDRLMAGKTTIMITHDVNAIADADQVLLLQDGGIAERGTHAELADRSERYRDLFDLTIHLPAGRLVQA